MTHGDYQFLKVLRPCRLHNLAMQHATIKLQLTQESSKFAMWVYLILLSGILYPAVSRNRGRS